MSDKSQMPGNKEVGDRRRETTKITVEVIW